MRGNNAKPLSSITRHRCGRGDWNEYGTVWFREPCLAANDSSSRSKQVGSDDRRGKSGAASFPEGESPGSIVQAVEAVHGGRWEEFRDCYGDWGRDAAIYLGRQRGRVKLQELAELSGGVGYTAVAQAIRRVRQQIPRDKAWRDRIDAVSKPLSKMKM
jgi:hypothetical protein